MVATTIAFFSIGSSSHQIHPIENSLNPMLFFLISCFSFILLSKSLPLKPLPSLECEMRELSMFLVSWLSKSRLALSSSHLPMIMPLMKKSRSTKIENVEEEEEVSLLDLPELALECILERLSPAGLCSMAGVCSSLRDRCRSDHLWEKHMKRKWGRVIGNAAYRKWQLHIASIKRQSLLDQSKQKGLFWLLFSVRPLSWIRTNSEGSSEPRSSLPVDSIMAWYLSLESGKFWFPAQVYNRENGDGFMLSCYDADLSYDSCTDTFQARYSLHRRQTIEENIPWHRLRAAPVDTPPHVLHVSDCLNDLKPGDHIEVQWRKNKEFPYGWWYGVVGHLESCNRNDKYCRCHNCDTVILEFNQYAPGSEWSRTVINRKDHLEEGNEVDGFYGGIRKLYNDEEISMWKHLWPSRVLE